MSEIMDKLKTTSIINGLYKRVGLAEPLIIWTQSPLESYLARAAVDVFCEESQRHPWHYHWWDRASEGAMKIRQNSVRSLIESGWKFGNQGIGYDAWGELTVYNGDEPVQWKDIPPSSQFRFERSDVITAWAERLEGTAVSSTIDQAISNHRNDFIIDIRSRHKYQMNHIGRERIGGSRNMHLNMMRDKERLLCQKNLSYFLVEVASPISGAKSQMTHEFRVLRQFAGHVMPFTNICFVSEPASTLKINRSGRLHCEDGPAVFYSDGFNIHAWDGVIFPGKWIKQKPEPREAFTWRNTEQRRIACEMVGWENILKVMDAKVVNKDKDPEIGELISVKDWRNEHPEIFLRVRCGTGRTFVLPVPPNMRTAREANSWTWGLQPSEYKPEVRP